MPAPNASKIADSIADTVDLPCYEAAIILEASATMLDLCDVEIETVDIGDEGIYISVSGWDKGHRNYAVLSVIVDGAKATFGSVDVGSILGESSALDILAYRLFQAGRTAAPSVRWSEWASARWSTATEGMIHA